MTIEALVEEFFAAIENGDQSTLERLYAEDAGVWHNFDGVTQTRAEGIQTLMQFAAAAESKYVMNECFVVGDTVIRRHDIHVRMRASGARNVIPVAIFITVRDGKIVRIYEYLDSSHVVPEAFANIANIANAA